MMLLSALLLGGVTVTLQPRAEVTGLDITVGEVATVTGEDLAEVDRVADTRLGYAPAPGYHRVLRQDLVRAHLKEALIGVDLQVAGSERVHVTPRVETLDLEALWGLGQAEVESVFVGKRAAVHRDGKLGEITVPAGTGAPDLRPTLRDRAVSPGSKVVAVQVWIEGELFRTVHLPFRVALQEERTVLARAVVAGERLTPGHFERRTIEVGFDRTLHGLPLEALQGTIATKAMAAGAVVTERDVKRLVVMHRDQIVTVRVRSGRVSASDTGVVQQDGRIGEQVHVVLQSSGRRVAGRVKSRELVEITLR